MFFYSPRSFRSFISYLCFSSSVHLIVRCRSAFPRQVMLARTLKVPEITPTPRYHYQKYKNAGSRG